MIVHNFVPFPAKLLAICAGAVFGVVLGGALIWVGAMLGALVAFVISRQLGRETVRSWIPDHQVRAFDRWTQEQGTLTLLVLRFIPVFAFNVINYAAGLTHVRLWTFIWTTGLGILPITVLSAYFGAHMLELDWTVIFSVSAVCILGVFLLHRVIGRRD
ncbi:MAG: TVP38/TMEM64 family protein [Paracoccaceae bacterium]